MFPGKTVMDKEEEDGESGERRRLMGREHVYIASGIFPIWNKGEEFFPPPSVFENVIILDRAFFLHSIIYRNFIFNILSAYYLYFSTQYYIFLFSTIMKMLFFFLWKSNNSQSFIHFSQIIIQSIMNSFD